MHMIAKFHACATTNTPAASFLVREYPGAPAPFVVSRSDLRPMSTQITHASFFSLEPALRFAAEEVRLILE